MAFKSEVIIDAPIEDVFEIFSTYKYAADALEHIVKVEKVTEGPVKVGTEFIERRHVRNMNIDNKLIVTEYVPYEHFAIKSTQNKLLLNYKYTFSFVQNGTKVGFVGQIKTKGIKNFFYRPLIEKIMKREDGDHLEKIKRYIEKGKSEES
ncbi:SRPBCC family protein [Bacillaceae bacterium W0354]